MLAIGLSGGIGCGKSAVSDILGSLGASIIDTDRIAHELTGPHAEGSQAIAKIFGPDLLNGDGSLNRAKMRQLVFEQPSERARLEQCLHPLILAQVKRSLTEAAGPYAVLVVPLLPTSVAYRALSDRILIVDCPEDLQITRVMQRSALSEDEVKKIIQTQASRAERLAIADDVIENTGSLDELRAKTVALHKRYLTLSQLRKTTG